MPKDVDTGRRKANMPPKFKHKHQQHKREEITDNELISLSVKDLNRLLSGLPPSEVRTLKHRRRTLKNRGYAAHCREKRVVQKEELASEKETLADENERLHRENLKMRKELKKLKKTFDSLTKFNKMNPKPKIRTVIPTKMMSLLK